MTTLTDPSPSTPTSTESTSAAASWRRLATGILFALPVLLVVVQLVVGEVIPPVVVFQVLFLGLAIGLTRTEKRWPLYTAAVLGVLLVAANAPFIVEDLAHPETFAGFMVGLTVPVVAIGLAASAVLATRKRPPGGAKVFASVGGGIIVVGAAASAIATFGVEDDVIEDGDIVVAAKDTTFPAELAVPAGDAALFVDNQDVFRHTLLIDGTDVKVELPGATARRVETSLEPGEYRYWCDVVGHEAMEGTLTVD